MEHPKKIYKSVNIEIKASDDEKREITAVGSKQVVDRDGDVVFVDGMKLTEYKKNPLFMWAHRGGETPENILGSGTKVWKDGKQLMFKLKFLDSDVNPRADMVYKMYKAGALRAFSIGFEPNWKETKFNEKNNGYDIGESNLFEISAVPVPANPFALIQSKEFKDMVESGEVDELEVKDFESYLTELGYKDEPTIEVKLIEDELDTKEEDELEDLIKEVEDVLEKDDADLEINPDNAKDSEHKHIEIKCVKCGHDLTCPECNVLVEKEEDVFEWIFKEDKEPVEKEVDGFDEFLNSL